MPRKPKPNLARPKAARKRDPKQFERFVETARKIGVDEDPEALDRALKKVVQPKRPP
jgi:hypothetical protein